MCKNNLDTTESADLNLKSMSKGHRCWLQTNSISTTQSIFKISLSAVVGVFVYVHTYVFMSTVFSSEEEVDFSFGALVSTYCI